MTPAELREALSRPSAAAAAAVAALDGDLVVVGAGGKMGPSLSHMARRALDAQGSERAVIAVSRFSKIDLREELEAAGVRTIAVDLLDRQAVDALPDAAGLIFMAGTKFGTAGAEASTWAHNALLPGLVAERYKGVATVVFSSGNIYPFVPVQSAGADEQTPPAPLGEYAQSVLARERIFEHFSRSAGTPTVLYRLNYAAELRYGVPLDIALKVRSGEPIDLAMGHFNMIWQGDANAIALACLDIATTPPRILNVTGSAAISVRELALRFGELFDVEPVFAGVEQETALLSNAARSIEMFGESTVKIDELSAWIADWLRDGHALLAKPTHYEARDGAF